MLPAVALTLAMLGAGCTSGDDEAESANPAVEESANENSPTDAPSELATTDGSTESGASSDGVPAPADLDGIEQLWLDNGTDPELASCYRGVLEDAGISEVADLNELAQVMSDLDDPAQQAIADCLG